MGGCQSSYPHDEQRTKHSEPKKNECKVGVFEIKIKSIFLHKVIQGAETAQQQKLRIEVSGQAEEFDLQELSFTPGEQTVCKFYVNSSWKQDGRIMAVEIWNHRNSDGKSCIGIFDLEPFLVTQNRKQINLNLKKAETKCFLNYEHTPAGFIEIQPKFHLEPYRELSFQLRSIQFQKQFRDLKNCFARVIIGEEKIDTQIVKIQKKGERGIEFDQNCSMMNFKIPESLSKGEIYLMTKSPHSEKSLGWTQLTISALQDEAEVIDSQPFLDNSNHQIGSFTMVSIPTMKSIPSGSTNSIANLPIKQRTKSKRASIENIILPKDFPSEKTLDRTQVPKRKMKQADPNLFKAPTMIKRKSSAQL